MTTTKPLSDAEFIKSIVTNVGDYYEDDANKFLGEALDRLEAANARIASMSRCNICGGDVVFNGGEPVEGMWGHRK